MAVFLLKAGHGSSYLPPSCTGIFQDVPCPSPFADWIERLYAEGVSGGCGTNPQTYCPDASVTRAQMAVFLTKSRHPVTCAYPASGTVFTDVPADYWAGGFIEQLWREGVTAGCGAGLFCPESAVPREQMAAFLVKGFKLP
jgi:hypothetical protein